MYLDLSDNYLIIGDLFEDNMTRIIRTLGCSKIFLKSSNCNQMHIECIENLLRDKNDMIKFMI